MSEAAYNYNNYNNNYNSAGADRYDNRFGGSYAGMYTGEQGSAFNAPPRRRMERERTATAAFASRPMAPRLRKPIYITIHERKRKVSLTSVITLMLIFGGALGMLYTNAMITNTRTALSAVNDAVKEKNDIIGSLEESLNVTLNLAEIEDIAVNRLGMARPKPYQMIHIDVPKQSYVVNGSDTNAVQAADAGLLSMGGIAGLLGITP